MSNQFGKYLRQQSSSHAYSKPLTNSQTDRRPSERKSTTKKVSKYSKYFKIMKCHSQNCNIASKLVMLLENLTWVVIVRWTDSSSKWGTNKQGVGCNLRTCHRPSTTDSSSTKLWPFTASPSTIWLPTGAVHLSPGLLPPSAPQRCQRWDK